MTPFPRVAPARACRISVIAALSVGSLVVAGPLALAAPPVPQTVTVQKIPAHQQPLLVQKLPVTTQPKVDTPQSSNFLSGLFSGKLFGFDIFGIFKPICDFFKGLFNIGGGAKPDPTLTPQPGATSEPIRTTPVVPEPVDPNAGTQPNPKTQPNPGQMQPALPKKPAQPQPTQPQPKPVQPQPVQPQPVQPKPEATKAPVVAKPKPIKRINKPGGGFGGDDKKPIEIILQSVDGEFTPRRVFVAAGQPVNLVIKPAHDANHVTMATIVESGDTVALDTDKAVTVPIGVVNTAGINLTDAAGKTVFTIKGQ